MSTQEIAKGKSGRTSLPRPGKRSRIRRHADRAVPADAQAILAGGYVAHVAFAVDGQPYVIPMLYHHEDGRIYLHGARPSRLLKLLAAGTPVCVSVTLLDGLVASRSAFYHSANYRSVVCFGRAEPVRDHAEMTAVFERMTARYFPDRRAGLDYQSPSRQELNATELVAVQVEEWNGKSRTGPPAGPLDADPDAPGSCGVVAIRLERGENGHGPPSPPGPDGV